MASRPLTIIKYSYIQTCPIVQLSFIVAYKRSLIQGLIIFKTISTAIKQEPD